MPKAAAPSTSTIATTIRLRRTTPGGSLCGTATLTIPRRISSSALGRELTSVIGTAPSLRFAQHRRRRASCEVHLRCQSDQDVEPGPQCTGDWTWDNVHQAETGPRDRWNHHVSEPP